MGKSILLKMVPMILLLSLLSACNQGEAISETQAPEVTIVNENELEQSLPIFTETPEILIEDLTYPVNDFYVSVEINNSAINNLDFDLLQSLSVKYIRFNGILWSEIEPTEGNLYWESMTLKEEFFRKANQYGISVIPIVRGTPVWAQKVYGYYCGAILEEKTPSFGTFMEALVNRYKTDEFNIHYWEIWNEPDVQPEFVKNTSQYGCWGDANDPYYGGGNYANMLKVISPIIKNADNSAKIVIGGLLLDCDPQDAGAEGRCQAGKEVPPKFLEGILINGGGDNFDIVSYHGYASDRNFDYAPWVVEEKFPNWSARGGVVMGKYNYIEELLENYGLEKDIFITETGYLCLENNLSCRNDLNTFYDRQAQYGVWLLVRNWIEGLDQTFWYTFNGPGWREGGILNKEQQPKPVYSTIQILTQRMQGAKSAQKLDCLPDGLQGYAINFEERTTWVVVSSDNVSHILDLSEYDFLAYDVFNKEFENQEGKLEIFYPVYVDFIQ
jgi:hypothetical protein